MAHTAWDDYLRHLGLTREEQSELDGGTITLDAFIDRKATEAALNAEGATELHPVDARNDAWRAVLTAAEQDDWDEDRRWARMPEVRGLTESMLINWAHACEQKHHDELRDERQRAAVAGAQGAVILAPVREPLVSTLATEDYEPEP